MEQDARRIPSSILVALAVASLIAPGALAQDPWKAEKPELYLDDVAVPVEIAFGQDGYLYIAHLTAREIVRVDMETGSYDSGFTVAVEGATWERGTETGLFSFALAPDFAQSGILYASYSQNESGEWRNVLSRITLLDGTGRMEEEVLLTRPGGHWHNGGRVMIADDHLWWTTGDAVAFYESPELARTAQEEGTLTGKVLRLTMDGEPAPGNPWGDHAYTKGHRNVFGIAWDPESNSVLVTENGNAATDYLYILEAGANYGWPDCEGPCAEPRDGISEPIWNSEGTIAPTGATWYRGAFWWLSFNKGQIYRTSATEDGWETEVVLGYAGSGRHDMLSITPAPDGTGLFFSTYNEVWRLPFAPHPDHPPTAARADGPYWWENTTADPPPAAITPLPWVLAAAAFFLAALGNAGRRRR